MDDTALTPQGQPVPTGFVPPVRSVEKPQVSAGHPEQALAGGLPPREAAPIDETENVTTASDDSVSQPDEVADAADVTHTEVADTNLQEAHPSVELAQELKEAGVEKGEDARREHLPEEQLLRPDEKAQQPDTQASGAGMSLPMNYQQAEETKKQSGIRDSLKWFAALIMYQWKKIMVGKE